MGGSGAVIVAVCARAIHGRPDRLNPHAGADAVVVETLTAAFVVDALDEPDLTTTLSGANVLSAGTTHRQGTEGLKVK
jgi:hypothetical protein